MRRQCKKPQHTVFWGAFAARSLKKIAPIKNFNRRLLANSFASHWYPLHVFFGFKPAVDAVQRRRAIADSSATHTSRWVPTILVALILIRGRGAHREAPLAR